MHQTPRARNKRHDNNEKHNIDVPIGVPNKWKTGIAQTKSDTCMQKDRTYDTTRSWLHKISNVQEQKTKRKYTKSWLTTKLKKQNERWQKYRCNLIVVTKERSGSVALCRCIVDRFRTRIFWAWWRGVAVPRSHYYGYGIAEWTQVYVVEKGGANQKIRPSKVEAKK